MEAGASQGLGQGSCAAAAGATEAGKGERERERETHMSGSFCVSMTAAIGMPKFETGPQKSACGGRGKVSGRGLTGVGCRWWCW